MAKVVVGVVVVGGVVVVVGGVVVVVVVVVVVEAVVVGGVVVVLLAIKRQNGHKVLNTVPFKAIQSRQSLFSVNIRRTSLYLVRFYLFVLFLLSIFIIKGNVLYTPVSVCCNTYG